MTEKKKICDCGCIPVNPKSIKKAVSNKTDKTSKKGHKKVK